VDAPGGRAPHVGRLARRFIELVSSCVAMIKHKNALSLCQQTADHLPITACRGRLVASCCAAISGAGCSQHFEALQNYHAA
jgi:hypothetical protein